MRVPLLGRGHVHRLPSCAVPGAEALRVLRPPVPRDEGCRCHAARRRRFLRQLRLPTGGREMV
eukprot:7643917-Alexandrium_andersonii.AAC.1